MDQSPAYQRGLLLYRQRRFDAAIEEFQRELAVNPNNASALSMLGLALALSGDAVAGEAAALKAIECAPDQALPKIGLPDGFAAKLMAENARQLYKLPSRV